uniref:Phlebovirus_G2 domain-containing protein n=1 Tax=Haemonchus contortus TaxID=6289 RepID=A0A7I4YX93_HAECO
MCYFTKFTARSVWLFCHKLLFHRRRLDRRYDVQEFLNTPLLTVISVIIFSSLTLSCQDIDVLFYRDSICTFGLNGVTRCTLETTEIMKLNTFNQGVRIRLTNRQAMEKEIRIQWRGLRLTCVKETTVFPRNTLQKVVDSKRCAHVGSCVDDKCASINTSSLPPELVQGNPFPGMTMCVESCGGIGCGCLALSSGCLYYKIFCVPQDEKIYEIFKCSQWKEEVELEITTISKRTETISKRLIRVQLTVPINYNKMRFTLTSLSFPPTPMLASSPTVHKWIFGTTRKHHNCFVTQKNTLSCSTAPSPQTVDANRQRKSDLCMYRFQPHKRLLKRNRKSLPVALG